MKSPFVSALLSAVNKLPPAQPEEGSWALVRQWHDRYGKPKMFHITRPDALRGYFPQYIELCREALLAAFKNRMPKIIDFHEVEVKMRHTCVTPSPDNMHCPQCDMDKRKANGNPVVKIMTLLEVDTHPPRMGDVPVEARQHKKRRNQSQAYHARIQKKWDKEVAGKTEIGILRTKEFWAFNRMQTLAFDKLSRAGYFNRNIRFTTRSKFN